MAPPSPSQRAIQRSRFIQKSVAFFTLLSQGRIFLVSRANISTGQTPKSLDYRPQHSGDNDYGKNHRLFREVIARLAIVIAQEIGKRERLGGRCIAALDGIIHACRLALPAVSICRSAEMSSHRRKLWRVKIVIHPVESPRPAAEREVKWLSVLGFFLLVVSVHILRSASSDPVLCTVLPLRSFSGLSVPPFD